MTEKTKIMLSVQELEIVNDTSWILTKQEIIKKVYVLFNEQLPAIGELFSSTKKEYPGKLFSAVPKISKGENYNGLPYVILDYPAIFEKDKIFAMRTMFWWGNFFSITLHLSGEFKEKHGKDIFTRLGLYPDDYYVCVNDNAWQHHFEASNYIAFSELQKSGAQNLIHQKDFLKIAVKIDLNKWNDIDSLLETAYKKMIQLLID